MHKIVLIMTKILTIFIWNLELKRKVQNKICNYIFTYKIKHKSAFVGENFRCGTFCDLGPNAEIGNEVWMSECQALYTQQPTARIKVGNYTAIGAEVLIITASHDYTADKIPFNEKYIEKDVVIKDFAWIGSRVTILPGAVIGKGAIIQAGSVVHGVIPDYSIAGGNPAVVYKTRDVEKFKTLEADRQFLIRK